MSEPIHGHEILNTILSASPPLSRQALAQTVAEQFGAEATFYTCSEANMTLDQLLEFLLTRGKVVEQDGALQAIPEQMCDHEA